MKKEDISKTQTNKKTVAKKISDDEMEILSFTSEYKTLKKELEDIQKKSGDDDIEILSLTTNYENLVNDINEYQKNEKKNKKDLLSLTTEFKNLKNELEEYKKKYEEEKEKNEQEKLEKIKKAKEKKNSNIGTIIIKIILLLVLIYAMFFLLFGVTRIENNSMHPTISKGDLVLFYRLDKNYKVGDVVTFKKDGKRYVLRILALENQTVFINNDDEIVNKNGYVEKQILFKDVIPKNSDIKYPYDVQENKVFVVGDYRLETEDSRMFGAIDIDLIDGKVISFLQTKDI